MFNKFMVSLILAIGCVSVMYPVQKEASQDKQKAELFLNFPVNWQQINPKVLLEKKLYYYSINYNFTAWGEEPLIWGWENGKPSADAPWFEVFIYKTRCHAGLSAARLQSDTIANFYGFSRKKHPAVNSFKLHEKGSLKPNGLHVMWHSGDATIFGTPCFIKHYFFFKDGYVYELLFTARQESAQKVNSQIDNIVNSMSFK
jgi:hypothetical protein